MDYSCHTIRLRQRRGQAVIEFTFGMILVLLMVYALMQIFRWNGVSLAERRIAHENLLMAPIQEDFGVTFIFGSGWVNTTSSGPTKQLDPYLYKPKKVKAVWGE